MVLFSVFAAAALLVAPLTTASPLVHRDGSFNGTGILNVVSGTKTVGCLTNSAQFTTDSTQCGIFTGVVTTSCFTPGGECSVTWGLSTSAGPCASIYQKGSQYEEGGNGVLTCSAAAASSDKQVFVLTEGVNDQIGMTLLEDSNGSAGFNTVGSVAPSATPQDLQDDLGVSSAVVYAITWTAK